MKRSQHVFLPLLVTVLLFLVCCQSPAPHPPVTKLTQTAMTIDYHISIGDRLTKEKKEEAEQIIAATFKEIDALYNKWNPESELSQINRLPAQTPLTLSPELYQFLVRLGSFVQLSEGRFDPTIEPLQMLWKEHLERGAQPSDDEINALKPCIGWHTLHLAEGTVWKEDGRTQVDLGGAAKGLCVDLLIDRLHGAGLDHLFVEWGGEMRTLGIHPSGRPWHIYITRLADPDPSAAIAHLDLTGQALATSGDYFQSWTIKTKEGKDLTYCHIFNPLTRAPLEVKPGSVASASLMARDCVTADALAKVLMLFDSVNEAQAWMTRLQEQFPELACWLATHE